MKKQWYDILGKMQELLYETDVIKVITGLAYEGLREREEESAEKVVYFMIKELEKIYEQEKTIVEQMDLAILEEKKWERKKRR